VHSLPLHSLGHAVSLPSLSTEALYCASFFNLFESAVTSCFILSTSCASSWDLSCAVLVALLSAILASFTPACASCVGVCLWQGCD
jgi:hypothetical protein